MFKETIMKIKKSMKMKTAITITCLIILLILLLPFSRHSDEGRRWHTRYSGLIYTVYLIDHEHPILPSVERGIEVYLFNQLFFKIIQEECSPHARTFDTDFLIEYGDAINAMFDYQWTLFSVEDMRVEPMESIPGTNEISRLPTEFTEWVIKYYDGEGTPKQLVLYNHTSFQRQIVSHAVGLVTEYYQEHFWNVYMGELQNLFTDSTRFHIRLLDICCKCNEEGGSTERYRRELATPEGAVRLHLLTPDNIFEMMPSYIRASIGLAEGFDVDQIDDVVSRVELMMESINNYTDNNFNASISIWGRDLEATYWGYVRGERVYQRHLSGCDGDGLLLFERYKGVFW